jgi:hypothetical protein
MKEENYRLSLDFRIPAHLGVLLIYSLSASPYVLRQKASSFPIRMYIGNVSRTEDDRKTQEADAGVKRGDKTPPCDDIWGLSDNLLIDFNLELCDNR